MCQEFEHVSAQCPSKARTLIIEIQSDSDLDDLEEIVHDPEGDAWEDNFDVDQTATLGPVLSMHPPSIDDADRVTRRLSVVRCTLVQLKKNDDWHKFFSFSNFH